MDRRHVVAADQRAVGVEEARVGQHEGDRAEADDEGQQVEVADPSGRPHHRLARFLGARHGEEAHQDMRQAGGAEHQRHAERDGGDRVLDETARSHDRQPLLERFLRRIPRRFGQVDLDVDRALEQRLGAETIAPHHHERHERRAGQEQAGLDDLHPGGGGHAAEEHVDHHQRADDDDGDPVVEAEQELDELPGADHLRDEVEGHDDQRAGCREDADRGLGEAEGGHVGEGELAEVAQAFGHEEGDHRPADEKADRVDQPVIARDHHRGGDAEERGGGHVVAGDGEAVLEAGDAAARGVEVGRRLGPRRGPFGDEEGSDDEEAEDADGGPVGGLLLGGRDGIGRQNRRRQRGQQGEARRLPEPVVSEGHFSASRLTFSDRSSNSLLARRT